MSTERKLLKLKNEMKDLEKSEQRLTGTLEALFKTLRKDLGDDSISEKDIIRTTRTKIKELKQKRQKALDQLEEKMEIITEKVEVLEA